MGTQPMEKHIVSAFREAFSPHIERRESIVLYGLSAVTGDIVSAFPPNTFRGLLDGFHESGEMYGLPILSLDEVRALRTDHIVIAARAQSTRIIVKRIRGFCREQGISLWDIEGEDLLIEQAQSVSDHPYFSLSMEAVKAAIHAHEVISFDVFDTLLMRRTLYFTDVFYLLEERLHMPGFAKARMRAEHDLYRQKEQPTLEEIYDALAVEPDLVMLPGYLGQQPGQQRVGFVGERVAVVVDDAVARQQIDHGVGLFFEQRGGHRASPVSGISASVSDVPVSGSLVSGACGPAAPSSWASSSILRARPQR